MDDAEHTQGEKFQLFYFTIQMYKNKEAVRSP